MYRSHWEESSESFMGVKYKHHYKEEWDAQVQKPHITSTTGVIQINTDTGGIHSVGTEFVSRDKVQMYSESGNIKLEDLVTEHKVYESNSNFFGLSKNSTEAVYQDAVKTVVASKNNIDITAKNANIELKNVDMITPATANLTAGQDVTITGTKLDNRIKTESNDFTLDIYGFRVIGKSEAPTSIEDMIQHGAKSVGDSYDRIGQSNNDGERALNVLNAGMDTLNLYNSILSASSNERLVGEITDRLGVPNPAAPTVAVGLNHTETNVNYQTYGTGSIQVGNLNINAGKNVLIEGVPVVVKQDMNVNAEKFEQRGVNLDNSSSTTSISAGFTYDIATETATANVSYSIFLEKL